MDCQAFPIVFFRIPYKKRAAAQFPCAAVFIPLIRPAASAHAAPAFRRIRTPHGGAAFPAPAPRACALKKIQAGCEPPFARTPPACSISVF